MFVDSSNPFMCSWSVANRFVDDLNRAEQRDGESCVCGDDGGFFCCFVCEIVAWNRRMTRDPLDKD